MTTAPPHARSRGFAIAILGIFVVVAALLFLAIYLALPGNQHFYALVTIGILALVFALGAYLAQAILPDPLVARSLSWGFAGLGFFLLLGTLVTNPASTLGALSQIFALIVVLLFLAAALAGAYWRSWTVASTKARVEQRAVFQSQPPRSALDYSTAQHEREVTQAPPSSPKGQS
ncbi:MAG TPA: hypothetical protein VN864_00445 [Thermoplasmata archaeon]|nr:hypothetical protein [Thermoplasmata archaeon]